MAPQAASSPTIGGPQAAADGRRNGRPTRQREHEEEEEQTTIIILDMRKGWRELNLTRRDDQTQADATTRRPSECDGQNAAATCVDKPRGQHHLGASSFERHEQPEGLARSKQERKATNEVVCEPRQVAAHESSARLRRKRRNRKQASELLEAAQNKQAASVDESEQLISECHSTTIKPQASGRLQASARSASIQTTSDYYSANSTPSHATSNSPRISELHQKATNIYDNPAFLVSERPAHRNNFTLPARQIQEGRRAREASEENTKGEKKEEDEDNWTGSKTTMAHSMGAPPSGSIGDRRPTMRAEEPLGCNGRSNYEPLRRAANRQMQAQDNDDDVRDQGDERSERTSGGDSDLLRNGSRRRPWRRQVADGDKGGATDASAEFQLAMARSTSGSNFEQRQSEALGNCWEVDLERRLCGELRAQTSGSWQASGANAMNGNNNQNNNNKSGGQVSTCQHADFELVASGQRRRLSPPNATRTINASTKTTSSTNPSDAGHYSQPAAEGPRLNSCSQASGSNSSSRTTSETTGDEQVSHLEPTKASQHNNKQHQMMGDQDDGHSSSPIELARLERQISRDQRLAQLDQDELVDDRHFYCAVAADGTLTRQPNVIYEQQMRPTLINQQQVQSPFNQHQQNLFFSTTQRPCSIYKTPNNSLHLNHSYQTLVEKLNEFGASTMAPGAHPFDPMRFRVASSQQQQSHLYQANIYSQLPGQATMGHFLNQRAPQQQYRQANGGPQTTTSPVFSSPTRQLHNYSSSSSDNFQQLNSLTCKRHYLTSASGPAGRGPNGGGPPGLARLNHAQRQLKWAIRRPQCWWRLLLLLLLGSLALLLLGALLLTHTGARHLLAGSQIGGAPSGQPAQVNLAPQPNLFAFNFNPQSGGFFAQAPGVDPSGPLAPPIGHPAARPFPFPQNVIKQQQQQPNSITSGELLAKWPALPILQQATAASSTTSASTSTTTTSKPELEASTQSFWSGRQRELAQVEQEVGRPTTTGRSCDATLRNCNGNGECNKTGDACACFAGHSGPTCAIVDCPNGCSQHGECKLRSDWPLNNLAGHQSSSLTFQATSAAKWRLSSCAANNIGEFGQHWRENRSLPIGMGASPMGPRPLFDHRLRWTCQCELAFTGADCSQGRELTCDDQQDNDLDGLADCEDDDCCSQPACRDNLMCYQPPEPRKVLASERAASSAGHLLEPHAQDERLFNEWKFLIANGSVQSYAQERAFEPRRVAIIRGRVLDGGGSQPHRRGIVSVRVSVMESAFSGFTLTRQDGHFDLLVNGDEWLTLQFHRNAYAPVKRRTFVRTQTINVLERDVAMWLTQTPQRTSELATSNLGETSGEKQVVSSPFQWELELELYKLLLDHSRQSTNGGDEDERQRARLFNCVAENLLEPRQVAAQNSRLLLNALQPRLLLDHNHPGPLRAFALVSQTGSAFNTKLKLDSTNQEHDQWLAAVYNSANFAPSASMAKPSVSIELLPANFAQLQNQTAGSQLKLRSIRLQLDIEGQTRREHFGSDSLIGGLSYLFAWNRRNVYDQKVYAFGELNVRVDYELELDDQKHQPLAACFMSSAAFRSETGEFKQTLGRLVEELGRKTIRHEGRIYMEAHQLNQQADVGQWALESASMRLDPGRGAIYFSTGPALPIQLAYPPVVSEPMQLATPNHQNARPLISTNNQNNLPKGRSSGAGQLLARGPNSSMFVILLELARDFRPASRLIQLDASGTRRLLDVPLAILTSKFQQSATQQARPTSPSDFQDDHDDLQLAYNNRESSLLISSRRAAKIVQISLASLSVLNKTLASGAATLGPDEEVDIEPLCGFGRQALAQGGQLPMRACRSLRLAGPHSMALDERNQLLYFVDGTSSLLALELATNLVLNLAASPAAAASPFQQAGGRDLRASCLGLGARLAPSDILDSTNKLHSLAWSDADSSLYLVLAESIILALRPDEASFEIVALGTNAANTANKSSPSSQGQSFCAPPAASDNAELGLIKALALDATSGHELVVLHQWQSQLRTKRPGHFYLAKLALGIQSAPIGSERSQTRKQTLNLVDLHSAAATWNPLIEQFGQTKTPSPSIDWRKLAQRPDTSHTNRTRHDEAPYQMSPESVGGVPFLHLAGGFASADSLAINSAESIFILNSATRSIQLVRAYSPDQFNSLELADSQERLFAASQVESQAPSGNGRQPTSQPRNLRVLQLPNPLEPDELLEFHQETGLLLSRTRRIEGEPLPTRLEFNYRILTNNQPDVEHRAHLDEDDENDHAIKRLVLDHLARFSSNKSSQLLAASRAYIRLASVKVRPGRTNNEPELDYELSRSYTGTRFVLQTIRRNQRTVCELATDRLGALTTLVQEPATRSTWTELIYDPKTYLLQNVITKTTAMPPPSVALQAAAQPSVMFQSTLYPFDDKLRRSTKRIIYDEIFNQYCDLFTVDA